MSGEAYFPVGGLVTVASYGEKSKESLSGLFYEGSKPIHETETP